MQRNSKERGISIKNIGKKSTAFRHPVFVRGWTEYMSGVPLDSFAYAGQTETVGNAEGVILSTMYERGRQAAAVAKSRGINGFPRALAIIEDCANASVTRNNH